MGAVADVESGKRGQGSDDLAGRTWISVEGGGAVSLAAEPTMVNGELAETEDGTYEEGERP